MRIGTGYDVHRLVSGRPLVLGGVTIPHDQGLLGHSDADVLTHAICDALLGAAGMGDMGLYFPDTDPAWAGIESLDLLQRVCEMIQDQWDIANVDVTLIAQAPKLAPHREAMRARLASVMQIDLLRVNIKATTTEGLGALGRGEGIAAQCVALLDAKAARLSP
jgi:2-C-methyl-D-erythritol 2,4-cyclodiphosphate synthase